MLKLGSVGLELLHKGEVTITDGVGEGVDILGTKLSPQDKRRERKQEAGDSKNIQIKTFHRIKAFHRFKTKMDNKTKGKISRKVQKTSTES